jgi:hypothetical protein
MSRSAWRPPGEQAGQDQERRFTERKDPAHRPPGAVPVEFVLLGYPVLDAPPLPPSSGDSG